MILDRCGRSISTLVPCRARAIFGRLPATRKLDTKRSQEERHVGGRYATCELRAQDSCGRREALGRSGRPPISIYS